jgi:hypothetical protein
MIDYQTYCQIRLFHQERGLSFNQIAGELGIRPQRHQASQQARRFQTRHHPLA